MYEITLGGDGVTKHYCEGCDQDVHEDEWGDHEELCNACNEAARETAMYRAWVLRGG